MIAILFPNTYANRASAHVMRPDRQETRWRWTGLEQTFIRIKKPAE